VTVTGSGVYNGESNLAEATYSGTTTQGQGIEFSAILGEEAWYFRYPQFADKMPEGKEWVKLEGFPGQKDIGSPGVASPDESLAMLRATGPVKRLGEAKIGGAQTTRYSVLMTTEQIAGALRSQGKDELAEQLETVDSQIIGPVRAEVFIAESGMLRRMRIASTEVSDGKTISVTMRMDFFDFGIEPAIQIPDDSQVYDLSPLLEEQLDALGQAS
jgi:hypothetical protein